MTVNSVASKNAIAVRTSSSGAGLTMRRSEVRHRSVISSRRRRRISRSSDGVSRGSSESSQQDRAAPERHEGRPAAGLGRVRGQHRRDLEPGDQRVQLRVRPPEAAQPGDRVGHRIREHPVPRRALALSQRPHPAAGLGQVDQPEIQGEGADDGLRGTQVEPAELLVETLALDRIVGAPERDRPLPDALDEREQLGSGLLVDDLAEQRPEQADLDRERVAGTGRADPERLGGDGRRDGGASATPSRGPSEGTVPGPIRHRIATVLAATFL